jgi:peptide deformylase
MKIKETTSSLRYWGDPVLAMVCDPVRDSEYGSSLEKFASQMMITMDSYKGVGLAAPQLGVPIRMFAMKLPDTSEDSIVVCNPTLTLSGATIYGQEGCLSLPEIYSQIGRNQFVLMRYFTPNGIESELELTGLDARIAQHETDHLNGIMFLDRLSRQLKRAASREWNKVMHKYQ